MVSFTKSSLKLTHRPPGGGEFLLISSVKAQDCWQVPKPFDQTVQGALVRRNAGCWRGMLCHVAPDAAFKAASPKAQARTDGLQCKQDQACGVEPENPVLMYNLGCDGSRFLPPIAGGRRIARPHQRERLEPDLFDLGPVTAPVLVLLPHLLPGLSGV